MTRSGPRCLLPAALTLVAAWCAAEASAQPPAGTPSRAPAVPYSGRIEVAAGIFGAGGYPLGSATASETLNERAPGRFTLFRTTSEVASVPGFDAKIAYRLTRLFSVEGRFSYSQPMIRTSIADDAESAPPVTFDGETLTQYVVGAGLVVHLPALSFAGGRGRPFVDGGAAYLRQLHDGDVLIDTGRVYHIGGGVKYLLFARPAGVLRGLGIRADASYVIRDDGFDFEIDRRRTYGAGGVSLFVPIGSPGPRSRAPAAPPRRPPETDEPRDHRR